MFKTSYRAVAPQPSKRPRRSLRAKGLLWLTTTLLLGQLSQACAPSIGDTCETNVECDTGAGETCDVSVPGGYCTVADCTPNACPDSSVCIRFDEVNAYCLKVCEADSDCRDGYACRKDQGDQGYCYVAKP